MSMPERLPDVFSLQIKRGDDKNPSEEYVLIPDNKRIRVFKRLQYDEFVEVTGNIHKSWEFPKSNVVIYTYKLSGKPGALFLDDRGLTRIVDEINFS